MTPCRQCCDLHTTREYFTQLLLVLALVFSAGTGPVVAAQTALKLTLDNDEFAGLNKRDRWYTSGMRLSHLSRNDPDHLGSGWAWQLRRICPATRNAPATGGTSHISIGQNLYTQDQRLRTEPLSNDRPIAAYLYGTVGNRMQTVRGESGVAIEVGVTGPAALGEPIQNGLHELIGVSRVPAWSYQLRPRLGVNLGFMCLGRAEIGGLSVLSQYEAWAGSTIAQASFAVAIAVGPGRTTAAIPGRARLHIPRDAKTNGWHLVVGVRGIWTGFDYLLDGSTFRYDNQVSSRHLTGEYFIGLGTTFFRDWQVGYVFSGRTHEFDGPGFDQANYRPQQIGSLTLRIPVQ
jgi:hypothetical protein